MLIFLKRVDTISSLDYALTVAAICLSHHSTRRFILVWSLNLFGHHGSFFQILRKCGGSLELVDVSGELPQLVRRPGIKKWKVSSWVLVLHFFLLNNWGTFEPYEWYNPYSCTQPPADHVYCLSPCKLRKKCWVPEPSP